jgi:hypothetical protein
MLVRWCKDRAAWDKLEGRMADKLWIARFAEHLLEAQFAVTAEEARAIALERYAEDGAMLPEEAADKYARGSAAPASPPQEK